MEEWLAVGPATEGDVSRFALEVGGKDAAHAGVGADPLGAMECGAEAFGPAVFAGVEDGELIGMDGAGGDLPDPDVDGAEGELPWGGDSGRRGWDGSDHVLHSLCGVERHHSKAAG